MNADGPISRSGSPEDAHESSPEKLAPEGLALVQRFVNSLDVETGDEELYSPEALLAWLAERGLTRPGGTPTQAELERALAVREGLRAALGSHNGISPSEGQLAALEEAAGHASLRATFRGDTPALEPVCGGVDAGLARLMAIVTSAAADGSWQRLKACADDGCRWAFYDHSRNRSGRWCSMATCGNQQKARAYRERTRADGSPRRVTSVSEKDRS
jgi:predicted RNA-binding Zn ribbon-like protein